MGFFLLSILIIVIFSNIEIDLCFIRKSLKEFKEKQEKIEYKEKEDLKEALKTFLEDY